jgi:hypothetical protein
VEPEDSLPFFFIFFFKLSIPCIPDHCIRLLNQTNAQYQIHISSTDIIPIRFGTNIPSSESACVKVETNYNGEIIFTKAL